MKLYKVIDTGATATSTLSHRGSTQSKTVRVMILKIDRECLRKVVEKSIINVMKLGE